MHTRALVLLLALVLVLGILPATAGAAPLYEAGVEFPVAMADNGQTQPDIDFPWIVWKDARDCVDSSEDQTDIYAYNFVTGVEVQVSSHEGQESNPSISGDWVVYSHDTDDNGYCGIYAYNLTTQETKLLNEIPDVYMGNPAIEGDIVVHNFWDQRDGAEDYGDIWAYDLSTDTTWAVNPKEGAQYEPEIGDGWVVYRDRTDVNEDYSVCAFNLETEEEVLVGEGEGYPWTSDFVECGDPSVDDGMVAYSKRMAVAGVYTRSIMLYDLDASTEATISTVNDDTDRRHPSIGDGLVTWHDDRVGVYEVYGYDLESEEEACIVEAVWDEEAGDGGEWISWAGRTATADGIVAWHDHRDEGINNDGTDHDDLYAMFLTAQEIEKAGEDRFQTAIEVSQSNYPEGSEMVIIATGRNFPDALAGASLAGIYNAPVLLVDDEITDEVAEEIERLGAEVGLILGRERAVSFEVQDQLEDLVEVDRLGGINRFETAKLIAEEAVSMMGDGWDGTAFLATGYNWPDALSAGPLSASTGWPIFLGGRDGDPINDYTADAMDEIGVTQLYTLGGPDVISTTGLAVNSTAIAGEDRYETAVAIAEFGVDEIGLSMGSLAIATGEKYPDALTAGPGQGIAGGSLLITPRASTSPAIMDSIDENSDTISIVKFIGGLDAITQSVRDSIMALLP